MSKPSLPSSDIPFLSLSSPPKLSYNSFVQLSRWLHDKQQLQHEIVDSLRLQWRQVFDSLSSHLEYNAQEDNLWRDYRNALAISSWLYEQYMTLQKEED